MNKNPVQKRANQDAFLAAYVECGTITGAAKAAGFSNRTHYDWLVDDDYRKRFDEACKLSAIRLEDEARRRAIEGTHVYKFDKDGEALLDPDTGQPYREMKYSDTLMIFLLKGNNPEKFGDKVEQTHKGDKDSPVVIFELPANGREAPGVV